MFSKRRPIVNIDCNQYVACFSKPEDRLAGILHAIGKHVRCSVYFVVDETVAQPIILSVLRGGRRWNENGSLTAVVGASTIKLQPIQVKGAYRKRSHHVIGHPCAGGQFTFGLAAPKAIAEHQQRLGGPPGADRL